MPLRMPILLLVLGLAAASCATNPQNRPVGRVETSKRALVAAIIALRDNRHTACQRLATISIRTASDAKVRSVAYTIRGLSNFRVRRYRQSFRDYSRAIHSDNQNWFAYTQRALLYAVTRRYGDARADANRAITLKPNGTTYLTRGLVQLASRKLTSARADFTRATQIRPKWANAWYWRGVTWHIAGARGSAKRDYDTALRLDPFHRGSRRNLDLLNRRAQPRYRPRVPTPKKPLDL